MICYYLVKLHFLPVSHPCQSQRPLPSMAAATAAATPVRGADATTLVLDSGDGSTYRRKGEPISSEKSAAFVAGLGRAPRCPWAELARWLLHAAHPSDCESPLVCPSARLVSFIRPTERFHLYSSQRNACRHCYGGAVTAPEVAACDGRGG